MLWIRIGFNADPDPGSQTYADPRGSISGSWSDFKVEFNVEFLKENIL
jgi:hypothetical protein